jgi:hypothetical protein
MSPPNDVKRRQIHGAIQPGVERRPRLTGADWAQLAFGALTLLFFIGQLARAALFHS